MRQGSVACSGGTGQNCHSRLGWVPVTTPVTLDGDIRRLGVEQALALAREVEATATVAPHGRVFDRCVSLPLARGREFPLHVFQSAAQHTADEAVKKWGRPHLRVRPPPPPPGTAPRTVGVRPFALATVSPPAYHSQDT